VVDEIKHDPDDSSDEIALSLGVPVQLCQVELQAHLELLLDSLKDLVAKRNQSRPLAAKNLLEVTLEKQAAAKSFAPRQVRRRPKGL